MLVELQTCMGMGVCVCVSEVACLISGRCLSDSRYVCDRCLFSSIFVLVNSKKTVVYLERFKKKKKKKNII